MALSRWKEDTNLEVCHNMLLHRELALVDDEVTLTIKEPSRAITPVVDT
jgi:hypothetical protein